MYSYGQYRCRSQIKTHPVLLTKIAHCRELLTVRELIVCNTSGAIEQVWLEKDMSRDYYISISNSLEVESRSHWSLNSR